MRQTQFLTDRPHIRHLNRMNARDLARAMEQFTQMSDDQKAAMGKAGRKFVEQRYDDRLVIQGYLEVLRKLGVTPQHSQNARRD